MSETDNPRHLDKSGWNSQRAHALLTRSAVITPHAGTVIAELVRTLVPNQRLERIEAYLTELDVRLGIISDEHQDRIKRSPEHIDLFEDGAFRAIRAIRAISEQRRGQIARIVAEGLVGDRQKATDNRRLLALFSELDDEDLVVLLNYVARNRPEWSEFARTHQYLLEPLHATIFSDLPVRERAALRSAIQSKLARLGLVKQTLMSMTSGVPALADQMVEHHGDFRVTELGIMVLHEASLISDEEYGASRNLGGLTPTPA